jgi:hypothetical protein
MFEEGDIAMKASNIDIPNCTAKPHEWLRSADLATRVTVACQLVINWCQLGVKCCHLGVN